MAQKYLTDTGKPNHTKIERVVEGAETVLFKSYFYQFDPVSDPALEDGVWVVCVRARAIAVK